MDFRSLARLMWVIPFKVTYVFPSISGNYDKEATSTACAYSPAIASTVEGAVELLSSGLRSSTLLSYCNGSSSSSFMT